MSFHPGSHVTTPYFSSIPVSCVIRIVVWLALPLAATTSRAAEPAPNKVRAISVKVLVLNFDPIVDRDSGKRLHQECRWQSPKELAQGYIDDIRQVSGGRIDYRIAEWKDLDEFPIKTDQFQYSVDEYLRCHRSGKGWHEPDGADYPRVIAQYKIAERIERREIDEVWWFGGPYFGFFESAMAGRGAFYINGGVFGADQVPCERPFAIMGYNYERGVAEMLHDLCHRTESTMSRIFGGWRVEQLDNDWARFAANFKQSNGVAAVGTCHYPPNAEGDYDYANKRFVESSADDWLLYPNLKGTKARVNCETWGGPDYHRNYMKWWFARLPHAPGVNATNGRLNDWWEYVFNFPSFDDRGQPQNTTRTER